MIVLVAAAFGAAPLIPWAIWQLCRHRYNRRTTERTRP